MDRRGFGRLAGAAALGAAAAEWSAAHAAPPAAPPRKRALMKVGTQHDSSDATLAILATLGVNNICSTLPSARLDEQWSVEGLTKLRERVESFGIALDCVPLPLSSHPIARAENPNLMLGRSPERDREIDAIATMIRNAARAGIPALRHDHPGRGAHRAHDGAWRRAIQHVLLREGGCARGRADGGRTRPRRRLLGAHRDVIRYFGSRGKIVNVHFRNIAGRFLHCRETFIDDGDVDMLQAVRAYKEVGYGGMLMPDHVPKIAGDTAGAQAFAYTFGYIKALIRAVDAEA
jgi:D-mannonate dehydratase